MSVLDDAHKSVDDERVLNAVSGAVIYLRRFFHLSTEETQELIKVIFDKLIEIGKRRVM